MANLDTTVTTDGVVKFMLGNAGTLDFIDEKVTGATSAAVDLTKTIPAYSRILGAMVKHDGTTTLATAVKLGLGISGDPDSILLSTTTMTDGTVFANSPLTTNFVSSATTVRISAVDTNGAAAGTFTGSLDVRIVYLKIDELA